MNQIDKKFRKGGEQSMSNLMGQPPTPGSLQDLKLLVQQFEAFLPEDKRAVIQNTIAQLEATGGVQNEAQGQEILSGLMQALGLTGLQK